MNTPVIAVTMGDPAGIGPEVCLKALAERAVLEACVPVLIGARAVLADVARQLDLPLPPHVISPDDVTDDFAPPGPTLVDLDNIAPADFTVGAIDARCGRASFEYVEHAIGRTLAGAFDALATGPLCKEALHRAGIEFPGHTEMLECLTQPPGAPEPQRAVMMLHSPRLAVSLVTTHRSLREVPGALDADRVEQTIRLTHDALLRLLGRPPRLAVLALNCHAGEGGQFGDEEASAIVPAVRAAQADGIDVAGPLAPDTAFIPAALEHFDGHVCMYHDQGLIPFKALSFDDGVNVTLGVPIVRTSVDHGTAFDIAGRGVARHASLVAAILLAARLSGR